MNKDFIMSYSGGKDCIFALYRMIENGYTPKALFTIMRHNNGASNGHRLSKEMLQSVSEAVNIPIYFLDLQCDIAYDDQLINFIRGFKNMGIDHCAFGDISLERSKNHSQEICDKVGMNAIFPLWQMDEERYVKEFLDAGFRSVIKSVFPSFPDHMLGRIFDRSFVHELQQYNVSICGENGEYHTFAFDGPIFKHPVSYRLGNQIAVPPYKSIEIFVK